MFHLPEGFFHSLGTVSTLPVSPTTVFTPSTSLVSTTVLVSTSPAPEPSILSIIFGLPSVVTCIPPPAGSTPESKMAIIVPLPSYSGFLDRKEVAPVSFLGCRAQLGNESSELVLELIMTNLSLRGVMSLL